MKILDRYVIVSFIKNYCISFMVLVGMYVVLDMVFNFNNMVAFQTNSGAIQTVIETLRDMGDYYFYQCFLIFVHLSGIIPVVAAAFTLMRLSRFNELTAMLAAGIPLLRVAMPILVAALLLNGLLLIDQELIIPNMIPKLVRDHDEIHGQTRGWFTIEFMQDADNGLLHAARFWPRRRTEAGQTLPMMEKMDVIERQPIRNKRTGAVEILPVAHVYADAATWNPSAQEWDLQNGWRVTGLRPDEDRSREISDPAYKSNITPEEINLYRSGNYVDLLSTERINELLDRPKSYGVLNLLRVKHSRFTQPIMNVILLMLCIPNVLTRDTGSLKSGATKCLIYMGIAMGSVFLSQQLAGSPPAFMAADRWAALMAWLPIFIFGPLSVFLLERIKT
ncbi:MAG TPA: LptF/LptG family permease [Tepidisphaeraceae bacterium]|jgi:lipopolysaccharide export system permease protein|nr:LptF/LptG family permease [Tepidisphaeraceae bacterium]